MIPQLRIIDIFGPIRVLWSEISIVLGPISDGGIFTNGFINKNPILNSNLLLQPTLAGQDIGKVSLVFWNQKKNFKVRILAKIYLIWISHPTLERSFGL